MKIQIMQRTCGCTEFLPQPSRLHLGAQNAEGVDRLQFQLPESWAGCSAALYLRRSDGTQLAPVPLDSDDCITVDRRLTGCTGGQWMLAAVSSSGYTAYTRPGRYDAYATLPTDGGAEDLPPTLYEQFVARVLESASTAATAAKSASANADRCTTSAAQAETAARQASTSSTTAAGCAARAEAAAARAEELAPADGQVLSVNGKSGVVTLSAQDVGALPQPAQPVAGSLLRVLSVNPDTGALLTDTTPPPDLTPYVRSSTVPTAQIPGPVRADAQYGVAVREDSTLTTVPASAAQLDSMTDGYAPVAPALLPYGVKKALTTAAANGQWTSEEKTAALRNLGADLSAFYTKLEADAKFGTPYSLPAATADQLGGVKVGEALDIDPDGTVSARTLRGTVATLDEKITAAAAVTSDPRAVWSFVTDGTTSSKKSINTAVPSNVDYVSIRTSGPFQTVTFTYDKLVRGGSLQGHFVYGSNDATATFKAVFSAGGTLTITLNSNPLGYLYFNYTGYHYPTLADVLNQVTAMETSVTDLQVALCELYEGKEEA